MDEKSDFLKSNMPSIQYAKLMYTVEILADFKYERLLQISHRIEFVLFGALEFYSQSDFWNMKSCFFSCLFLDNSWPLQKDISSLNFCLIKFHRVVRFRSLSAVFRDIFHAFGSKSNCENIQNETRSFEVAGAQNTILTMVGWFLLFSPALY